MKLDITRLVDTVNVTETSSDGEIWGNWRKSLVDGKDILRLCVERVVVNILVVDTVLLTTSDTDFLYRALDSESDCDWPRILDLPSQAIASLVPHA